MKKIFDRIALAAELTPGVLLIAAGLALAVGNHVLWL